MEKLQYVLIFAFNAGKVLLRMKQKPDWQSGKWNGLGGTVEPQDREFAEDMYTTVYTAQMAAAGRKFDDETGLEVASDRFMGGIYVPYPQVGLWVYWIDLTDDEAKRCWHVADEIQASYCDGEYNQWFLMPLADYAPLEEDVACVDLLSLEDDDALVESTYELIQLIYSIRRWWST